MAKKESPKVDENFMRAMISEGIPIKREAIQQQAKKQEKMPVQKPEDEKREEDQPQEENALPVPVNPKRERMQKKIMKRPTLRKWILVTDR